MALSYDDAMDELLNTDLWMDVGFVAAGYLAPRLANNIFAPLPGEVYGLASFLGGEMIDQRGMTLGGGLYTVERAADRFGIDASTVTGAI